MNLVIKPITFYYEDTEFCSEEDAAAFGVFDWSPKEHEIKSKFTNKVTRFVQNEPYGHEWIAAFTDKQDAEFYLNWKKEQ